MLFCKGIDFLQDYYEQCLLHFPVAGGGQSKQQAKLCTNRKEFVHGRY